MKRAFFWLAAAIQAGAWSFGAFVLLGLLVSPSPTLRAEPVGMWIVLLLEIGHLCLGAHALIAMRGKYQALSDDRALTYIGGTRTNA